MVKYCPDRGDVFWINFYPQQGNEIQKRRPAIAISPKIYNSKTNLVICAPITSKQKGYPFEVILEYKQISGVILSDQIKSLDWQARECSFICKANDDIINETIEKLQTLIAS